MMSASKQQKQLQGRQAVKRRTWLDPTWRTVRREKAAAAVVVAVKRTAVTMSRRQGQQERIRMTLVGGCVRVWVRAESSLI